MESLQTVLGYSFNDPQMLVEALTHASLGYESQRSQPDNQRLEFLGDSVFQLTLSEMLFLKLPTADEGVLTKMRAELVSTKALALVARRMNLGGYLLMGRGEEASGGRERDKSLADALEAIAGAIYLDGGMAAAKEFAVHLFSQMLASISSTPGEQNPKGHLQEVLQSFGSMAPTYSIVHESGPDHAKSFEATVSWQGKLLGRGEGRSKKEAEVDAARSALNSETVTERLKYFGHPNYKAARIVGEVCEESGQKGAQS